MLLHFRHHQDKQSSLVWTIFVHTSVLLILTKIASALQQCYSCGYGDKISCAVLDSASNQSLYNDTCVGVNTWCGMTKTVNTTGNVNTTVVYFRNCIQAPQIQNVTVQCSVMSSNVTGVSSTTTTRSCYGMMCNAPKNDNNCKGGAFGLKPVELLSLTVPLLALLLSKQFF